MAQTPSSQSPSSNSPGTDSSGPDSVGGGATSNQQTPPASAGSVAQPQGRPGATGPPRHRGAPPAAKASIAVFGHTADLTDARGRLTKLWHARSTKVVAMLLMVGLAIVVVARSIEPEEFKKAFEHMNPWWFAAAFAVGTLTWVGAAITMMVFSPVKLRFKDVLLTQIASSFVGVVAPSGLGTVALSLRFLTKQKLASAQAVAALILMELAQFLTSFVLIIFAIVFVGVDPDIKISWKIVGWVAAAVVVVLIIAVSIRQVRHWAITEIASVWARVKPQAIWAFKHPKQLGIAICGSVLQTASFAASFMFSLLAFGTNVNFLKVAAAYLVANTLGSMIPVPGGVGSIEGALTVGMTAIGVSAAVALSAAVTFRLATFYIQIPIGWVAFQYLTRKKII